MMHTLRGPSCGGPSTLALRQAILTGVLVAGEADVEDAALQELTAGRGLLRLADCHGVLTLLLLAIRDRNGLPAGAHLGCRVEEQVGRRHPLADAALDRGSGIIGGISIEITATAVLATLARHHCDPHVQVVGPPHDLEVNAER